MIHETDEQRESRIERVEEQARTDLADGVEEAVEWCVERAPDDEDVLEFLRAYIIGRSECQGKGTRLAPIIERMNRHVDWLFEEYVAHCRDVAENETDEDRRAEKYANEEDAECSERGSS